MDDHLILLDGVDGWQQVLACYAPTQIPDASTDFDQISESNTDASADNEFETTTKRTSQPWKKRVTDPLGMEAAQISRIHGRLVASGLLEIDVVDRTAGLCYRLTREGKKVVQQLQREESSPTPVSNDIADYLISA